MRRKLPVALTIAGSDSGGGAGIQADLKTFAALGVHGASAIACLTAQNPKRVLGIEPCSPKMLRQQLEAVFEELNPRAVKTGMLFSAESIFAVARFLKSSAGVSPALPLTQRLAKNHLNKKTLALTRSPGRRAARATLIVDPVLVSTSGRKLLEPKALKILKEKLLPLATLVTPNLSEAEILSGQKISSLEEMAAAAKKIHAQFGCAVLVKGGHLVARASSLRIPQQSRRLEACATAHATDIFFDGKNEIQLSAPFVKNVKTHGTGCVYSAAICAALAKGENLFRAVQTGKKFVTGAIANSYKIGNHFALGLNKI